MKYKIRDTNSAFTLVEILIVVAILGILAAVVVPEYVGHTQLAKESAAKDNLRIIRNAIELYTSQHNDVPPGYAIETGLGPVHETYFRLQIVKGNYLSAIPENPFNNKVNLLMIADDQPFPIDATGEYGWVYKAQTKQFHLDWPGTDQEGVRFYDY